MNIEGFNYKEQILLYLRQGMIVVAPRQCGKTEAMLEFAKFLLADGNSVTIQVPAESQMRHHADFWERLYGTEKPPRFQFDPRDIDPRTVVLIDEYSYCRSPYGRFFAATDSVATMRSGYSSTDHVSRMIESGEARESDHIKVVLPMFTWDTRSF